METKVDNGSDDFLIACMAYCLLWELSGARVNETASLLRNWVENSASLGERQRWMVELYEERPPSVQEERSVLIRMQARLEQRGASHFRNGILRLIPEPLRNGAGRHSLMAGLGRRPERSLFNFWRKPALSGAFASKNAGDELALAEREQNFIRFLELPYFVEGFRQYWRAAPKNRSNLQTRVLLTLAAALSQVIVADDADSVSKWIKRLEAYSYHTQTTYRELEELVAKMSAYSYDPQELAFYMRVDAKEADRGDLIRFIEAYRDEFPASADSFLQRLKLV